MSIHTESITVSKILELIEKFLSKAEQKWLNTQLSNLLGTPDLSLTQKRNLVDELCGSWAADSSIPAIFAEIEQQRAANKPRKVLFE